MPAVTVTEDGQIVIPVDIQVRYGLTPGTQVEFVDGGGVRLLVRRRVQVTDPAAGFGLIKVKRTGSANGRRLSDFNAADLFRRPKIRKCWRLAALARCYCFGDGVGEC